MVTYYVDGQFLPKKDALIPIDDLAILRGFGVFDIIRAYDGHPCLFDEHIRRLENSAKQLGLLLPWDTEFIKKAVLSTLDKNRHLKEANIRIVITGGSSDDFMTPQGNPRLLILISPVKKLPDHWYSQGVKLITMELERDVPNAKSTSYIPAAMALKKAKQENAVEAVYYNRDKMVLECATSNIFGFSNNALITPDRDILKGVTREAIIRLAKETFVVEQRAVSLAELLTCTEIFICGTNKRIVPVVNIDENTIGNGRPGKNTQKLMQELEHYTKKIKYH